MGMRKHRGVCQKQKNCKIYNVNGARTNDAKNNKNVRKQNIFFRTEKDMYIDSYYMHTYFLEFINGIREAKHTNTFNYRQNICTKKKLEI